MKGAICRHTGHVIWDFVSKCMAVMAVSLALLTISGAQAADTLVYSFEPDLQGFGFNGGGTTVTQDTIGATEGTHSMKVAIVAGQTFSGANTAAGTLNPAIGDPPGLDHVTFDVTVPDPFPGTFAVVGVIIFGVNQSGQPRQIQTGPSLDPTLEFHLDGLPTTTQHDVTIDMTRFIHPETFEPGTFNDIMGTQGSGPNDIIPTGFELYFNKSGDAPLTAYIDNIRVGTKPAAVPGDYNGNGVVDAADYVVWRNGGPLAPGTEVADPGTVSNADYTEWRSRFGNVSGSGSSLSVSSVPEPGSGILLLVAAICFALHHRDRPRFV